MFREDRVTESHCDFTPVIRCDPIDGLTSAMCQCHATVVSASGDSAILSV